tara:strand:- start:1482 stop:2360 length:879 start_codon:yes stop_codon:yes gene_type:complete
MYAGHTLTGHALSASGKSVWTKIVGESCRIPVEFVEWVQGGTLLPLSFVKANAAMGPGRSLDSIEVGDYLKFSIDDGNSWTRRITSIGVKADDTKFLSLYNDDTGSSFCVPVNFFSQCLHMCEVFSEQEFRSLNDPVVIALNAKITKLERSVVQHQQACGTWKEELRKAIVTSKHFQDGNNILHRANVKFKQRIAELYILHRANVKFKQRIAELELLDQGFGECSVSAPVAVAPAVPVMTVALASVQASVPIRAESAKENIAVASFKATAFQTIVRWGAVVALGIGALVAFA